MTADPARLQLFRSIDDRLAEQPSRHRRPAWWDTQAERGYLHPTAKRKVFQVGRGGNKSTECLRFAETEMLSPWSVPPPERHYFAWVSENTDEANQRPKQIEADLRALGIPCTRTGNTVEIDGMPIGFKSFACRVGAVSGFRCIGFVADEEAKWRSVDTGSNPAREVIASLRAMTVTHPDAREWHVSSPLGMSDYHFEQFALGDTDTQIVANAPSWVANPGAITEEQTRRLEPDPRIWAREYGAIPQTARLAAFPFELVMRAFEPRVPEFTAARKVLLLDPSSGGTTTRDRFTWAVASHCADSLDNFPPHEVYIMMADGNPMTTPWNERVIAEKFSNWQPRGPAYLRLHEVGAIEGGFAGEISGDAIAEHLAAVARRHGVRVAHSDQREALFLGAALSRQGLVLRSHNWTAPSKADAVTLLRRWLSSNTLSLPASEPLRRELLAFEEQITPSGSLTYSARRGGHDDHVALLITLAHAELSERPLERSPIRRPQPRGFVSDTAEGRRTLAAFGII